MKTDEIRNMKEDERMAYLEDLDEQGLLSDELYNEFVLDFDDKNVDELNTMNDSDKFLMNIYPVIEIIYINGIIEYFVDDDIFKHISKKSFNKHKHHLKAIDRGDNIYYNPQYYKMVKIINVYKWV